MSKLIVQEREIVANPAHHEATDGDWRNALNNESNAKSRGRRDIGRSLLCLSVFVVVVGLKSQTAAFAGEILGLGPNGTFLMDPVTGAVISPGPPGYIGGNYVGDGIQGPPGDEFFTTVANLYVVDLATGQQTFLGPFGNILNAVPIGELAYDPASGTLYGIGGSDELYSINYQSGLSCGGQPFCETPITAIGPAPGDVDSIYFLGGGIYGVDNASGNLYRINPANGQENLVGPTGIEPGDGVLALAYDAEAGAFIASVSIGSPDLGAWINTYAGTGAGGPGALYQINPDTGAATFLSTPPVVFDDMIDITPEPSTGVCMLLAIGASILAVGRREVKARRLSPARKAT